MRVAPFEPTNCLKTATIKTNHIEPKKGMNQKGIKGIPILHAVDLHTAFSKAVVVRKKKDKQLW